MTTNGRHSADELHAVAPATDTTVRNASALPKLTANQKRFVEEYAIDRNAVKAFYRAFGRTTKRGSKRSYSAARVDASKLLANPNVKAELDAAQREHRKACRISAVRVIRAIAKIAFADRTEAYEPDDQNGGLPKPRALRNIPPSVRCIIDGVKVRRRRVGTGDEMVEEIEYKFASRMEALKLLVEHLGLTKGGSAIEMLLARIDEHEKQSAASLSVGGGD